MQLRPLSRLGQLSSATSAGLARSLVSSGADHCLHIDLHQGLRCPRRRWVRNRHLWIWTAGYARGGPSSAVGDRVLLGLGEASLLHHSRSVRLPPQTRSAGRIGPPGLFKSPPRARTPTTDPSFEETNLHEQLKSPALPARSKTGNPLEVRDLPLCVPPYPRRDVWSG